MFKRNLIVFVLLSAAGVWSCADAGTQSIAPDPPDIVDEQPPAEAPDPEVPDTEGPEDEIPDPVLPDPDDGSTPPDDPPHNPRNPIESVDCLQGTNLTYWHAHVLRSGDSWQTFPTTKCTPDGVIAIIPRGTTWEFEIENLGPGDQVRVYTPHYFTDEHLGELRDPEAVSPAPNQNGQASFRYTGVHGGEHVLRIDTADKESTKDVLIQGFCVENCDRITTRFPLVMVHGFLGTDNYFGILDYWSGIIPPLRRLGGEVFTPSSSMVNSSFVRAQSVAEQIDDALAETGARRVNLIGHSQGGLDARIIASPGGHDRSSNIASITTIATPHKGVPIPLLDLLSGFINVIFDFPNFGVAEAKAFNKKYVDAGDTTYYSWSFRTCDSIDLLCQIKSGGEKVNSLLEIFFRAITISTFGGGNDGLVTVDSANWGPKENQFGPLWADHMDQIGQIARFPNSEAFNHVTFYQDWARSLIIRGH